MKHSLKRQMSVVFMGLIIFVLVLMFIINSSFLEQYYIVYKQDDLTSMYKVVNDAQIDGTIRQSTVIESMNRRCEQDNISAVVVASSNDSSEVLFMTEREDNGQLADRLLGYLLGKNDGKILQGTTTYEIRKARDPVTNTEYIEMWGYLSDNSLFIMRSPLASIKDSAQLANKFLVYIGVLVILLGAILVGFFSKRITDPILELAVLSKRMAGLDFDARYTSGGDNEIGVLGENFNIMSQTLEHTISELKRANNNLIKDIEQKEKLEDMRTEFLGNVSHELKTPIALIQGYAEGLKEGVNDDPESREFYCDVIMDEAGKMNQMVKNLLTLNQLEFGADEIQYERFDVVSLIRGVIQSCEILVQQAEAQVTFVESEPVRVWADEFKTEQVIRNYVTNAIHHVANEKRIEIKIQKKEDSVRVSVFNSGSPIPEEDLDKLWDKFYKVDKAHTREYGGNGIGLSIVKAIMESHHQQYGVSNYNNGVEFWFELDTK